MNKQNKFVTEEALDDKLGKYSQQVVQDISKLFYEKIDAIQIGQDKLLKKFETWEQENAVGADQIHELNIQVDNHEERLKKLESAKN